MKHAWWQKAVVYQIYPKSFQDTTGNGVGDIQGIIKRLDYLKNLGIDVIWLTPIYASPQKDNGYDISDYYSVHPDYGDLSDFDQLVEEAHKKGIKLIMDIVVNHTSTEHKWFKEAASSKDNPYREYYIWKDGKEDGSEPTNWQSKFGGNAWKYDAKTKQYYLHLFDVTQADLNWENEKLREDIYEMMHFWFKKGVDGFRLDVINLISKDQQFLDDDGSIPPGDGRRFYTDGPRVHEFIHEMNKEVFSKYDSITVGEMSSTTLNHCIKYSNPEREELSMTFNFHHLKVDYPNGQKWELGEMDFQSLKQILSSWQVGMNEGGGWNALFWCNHDQPRIVSRFGNDGKYHCESAKMLATTIHMMQGTPYIYQGEEFGMTNPNFKTIDQYRDVESLNMYEILKEEGKTEEEILAILRQKSRDNSRTPVQWDDTEYAGFSTTVPWIEVASNYKEINAKIALEDSQSIFFHYKKLIELRKKYEVITSGTYELLQKENKKVFAYLRSTENEKLIVINNFFEEEAIFRIPEHVEVNGYNSSLLINNYADAPVLANEIKLRPYESLVYYLNK